MDQELIIMAPVSELRHTRFVCISDTHNTFPKLPRGDVLIHAGDLTNQGSLSELRKTVDWLEKTDFETKIIVAGNHDITLDSTFYNQHGLAHFHNQDAQNPDKCLALLTESSSLTYLNHEARTIRLTRPEGPGTTFKVFGSPYSPSRGLWAFGYESEDADAIWEQIPLDCDIVITHTPPKFHCDESPKLGSVGCESLRRALWRTRPQLAVCGHVHEARGVERVLWELKSPNVKYQEKGVLGWQDGTIGTRKQFCVDLTSRSQLPLRNDGALASQRPLNPSHMTRGREIPSTDETRVAVGGQPRAHSPSVEFPDHAPSFILEAPERPMLPTSLSPFSIPSDTSGQGGPPCSTRCDFEVLLSRAGRAETCIINAAILGSSWPHQAGKKFNKPIVIDIDLPVAVDKESSCFGSQELA